jgi:CheY-like chemotaxis protein
LIRGDILLVDDDPDLVELIQLALRASGMDAPLRVARDGAEALEILASKAPLPSVVLLDLDMPRVHGMEVLARMRQDPRTACVPVVVLTASVDLDEVSGAYERGANSFVRKEFGFDALQHALDLVWRYWLLVNQPATTRVSR